MTNRLRGYTRQKRLGNTDVVDELFFQGRIMAESFKYGCSSAYGTARRPEVAEQRGLPGI